MTVKTSDVLNRAADLIEERGWGRGPRSMIGEGGVCIMGAVYAAQSGHLATDSNEGIGGFRRCPAGEAIYEHLREQVPDIFNVWQFNDARDRTASEVIEALRACAVIEASREREAVEVSA